MPGLSLHPPGRTSHDGAFAGWWMPGQARHDDVIGGDPSSSAPTRTSIARQPNTTRHPGRDPGSKVPRTLRRLSPPHHGSRIKSGMAENAWCRLEKSQNGDRTPVAEFYSSTSARTAVNRKSHRKTARSRNWHAYCRTTHIPVAWLRFSRAGVAKSISRPRPHPGHAAFAVSFSSSANSPLSYISIMMSDPPTNSPPT